MSKPVILTGLRANNDLHIGNYFGALLPLIDMAKSRADDFQVNLFVPDLHSFTTPVDHSQLQAQIWNNLRLFAAAGLPLDHPDIHIYRQSYVPAHSELTWILDCFTGFGQMNRMTQFKDKSSVVDPLTRLKEYTSQETYSAVDEEINVRKAKEADTYEKLAEVYGVLSKKYVLEGNRINDLVSSLFADVQQSDKTTVGLFNYPVLMAADMLLYGAEYVPVGDDQSQHIEYTRDIGERMNSRFNQPLFKVPKSVKEQHEFFGKDQGLRIKDLIDPTKKMSKSDTSERGIIFLGDDPEDAAKKVMGATTDSEGNIRFDFEKQPGVSNLIQIQSLLLGQDVEETARHREGKSSYGDLKREVAELVQNFLADFQGKLSQVNDEQLAAKLADDERAMNDKANETLYRVQQAVGLRPAS
jgi:tryptophanyl-tRNA synthetase